MPTCCVTWPAVITSGVIAELIGCVTCCTAPDDSVEPIVVPAAVRPLATVSSTVPTGVVTGASGASGPVPSALTVELRPETVLLVAPTTLPRPATVVPTGSFVEPICPSPLLTASAAAPTIVPVLDSVLPTPFVTPSPRPGRLMLPTVLPRSVAVWPTVLMTPLVPVDEPLVPLVPDVPLVLGLLLSLLLVGGELTPPPPQAASRHAAAKAVRGARHWRRATVGMERGWDMMDSSLSFR